MVVKLQKIKNNLLTIIFSFLLSLAINFQIVILNNHMRLNFLKQYNIKYLLLFIITFFIIFILVKLILIFFAKMNLKKVTYDDKTIKRIFFLSFFTMIIFWSFCFIIFYPGAAMFDTYNELQSPIFASSTHPILFSFIIHFFVVTIGYNLLGSSIIGWVFFSILQMLFIAFSISFSICFLAKRNCPKFILIILALFYAITPIYAAYSIFAIKDVLFSILLLYVTLLVIKVVETDGNFIHDKLFKVSYVLLFIMILFTRNNGIVVYLLLTLLLIIIYRKSFNKMFIVCLFIPLILNFAVTKIIEIKWDVKHLFQESIAIPLQQIGATVYTDGKINNNDLKYINKLMPINLLKENFANGNADAIKWNDNFNRQYLQETKGKFIKVWFRMLPNNFSTYVESYLLQTYYFWSVNFVAKESNMFYDTFTETSEGYVETIKDMYNIRSKDLFNANFQNKAENFYYRSCNFLSEGTMFWLSLLLMIIFIYNKNWRYFLIVMPLFTMWLSIIVATPVNTSLRYVLPYVYILPLLVGYAFVKKNKGAK